MNTVRGKRIYDSIEETDGCRILVDRLWPRGIKKTDASLREWAKEIAPSNGVRKQFHADKDYDAFRKAYWSELDDSESVNAFVSFIKENLEKENVTLLTASKNPEQCNLSALIEYLQKKFNVS